MAQDKTLQAHLFICTNERENGECCAQKGSVELRDRLKKIAKERGWSKKARVNASGCLGHCEEGITAVIYPQGRWFTQLTTNDCETLEKALAEILE